MGSDRAYHTIVGGTIKIPVDSNLKSRIRNKKPLHCRKPS